MEKDGEKAAARDDVGGRQLKARWQGDGQAREERGMERQSRQ